MKNEEFSKKLEMFLKNVKWYKKMTYMPKYFRENVTYAYGVSTHPTVQTAICTRSRNTGMACRLEGQKGKIRELEEHHGMGMCSGEVNRRWARRKKIALWRIKNQMPRALTGVHTLVRLQMRALCVDLDAACAE